MILCNCTYLFMTHDTNLIKQFRSLPVWQLFGYICIIILKHTTHMKKVINDILLQKFEIYVSQCIVSMWLCELSMKCIRKVPLHVVPLNRIFSPWPWTLTHDLNRRKCYKQLITKPNFQAKTHPVQKLLSGHTDTYTDCSTWTTKAVGKYDLMPYKWSAVAEMGDRLATINIGHKLGDAVPPWGWGVSWVPM